MTAHVPGVHGQDLIQAGHAAAVLHECGRMLRLLQSVNSFPGSGDHPRRVLVHGDYGPNNMLFDPVTVTTTAVLDWEWAHPGDPIEDLAWCEWIIRMHHPDAVDDLDALFTGYGERPRWPARQAAMVIRCRSMLTPLRPGVRRWERNVEVTAAWTERPDGRHAGAPR
ncbi:phosphotransferase family protein [Actinoplanes sp. HUAS TT8]|uniref:phosphotransferase family protein n=1 Tax=Actinoplanes sp. HUAS TT8 TaxID=3447453 RepID=UPI003F523859